MKTDIANLEKGQARLEKKMDKGFKFLEVCINEAAKDTARTDTRLKEHIELPYPLTTQPSHPASEIFGGGFYLHIQSGVV